MESSELIDPESDVGWNTTVAVCLKPHPDLSPLQRQAVMRDYGMKEDRCVLECRKAILFYTLRHLNLQELVVSDNPATQQVVVDNVEKVKRWMSEDRAGVARTQTPR